MILNLWLTNAFQFYVDLWSSVLLCDVEPTQLFTETLFTVRASD